MATSLVGMGAAGVDKDDVFVRVVLTCRASPVTSCSPPSTEDSGGWSCWRMTLAFIAFRKLNLALKIRSLVWARGG